MQSNNAFPYAELQCISNFSLLHGASHPEEIIHRSAELGYKAVALCDHNSLAGVVRAFKAAESSGITFIAGTTITIGKFNFLAHPISRQGYGNLSRTISIIKQHEAITLDELSPLTSEIAFTLLPPDSEQHRYLKDLPLVLECILRHDLLSIAISKSYQNQERQRLEFIELLAKKFKLPLLATNNVLYHSAERRILQDVLYCTRIKKTVAEAGFELQQNSERFLKPTHEMHRLFRYHPEAISRGLEIAEICSNFSLDQLRYEYPNEITPNNQAPEEYLRELTFRGATERYPAGVPEKVTAILEEELTLIHELNYEKYFLTCYDIVRFAHEKAILCQGRGAAANSAVCYCLGITSVDPVRIDLLFARFISKERNEPPDIDIDFEHERREEVIQYIYERYGRERAGLTCEVVTYQHRSAVRDVGRALGLSIDTVQKLAKSIHRWNDCVVADHELRMLGFDPNDAILKTTLALSQELLSFPRHLSQHVGGFVISETPLCEIVPILPARMEKRTIIEWDKDDIEALGMLKIDVLGLGMLSCIRKAIELINQKQQEKIALHSIPAEDPAVYRMICAADTIGVFQIESRAQMSMLPRLKPQCFYDLVIEVAIVRPGPIQGNMVHPYLKRRSGIEKPYYPDERVKEILGKTFGVPLFQEQAMRLAIVLAKFSPGEAEQLRRAIGAWKRNKELIATFTRRVIHGMMESGYAKEFAESCMRQIKGFSEYGFPESHAASFALLVYVSSWLKRYHPAEFTAALLNSQPMGFYAPSQIIRDLQKPFHKERSAVAVLPIDVNKSLWDCTVENGALRLGLRLVKGLRKSEAVEITALARLYAPFNSIQDFWNHAKEKNVKKSTLIILARTDAFRTICEANRHQALWEVHGLIDEPLLKQCAPPPTTQLPAISRQESMFKDYEQLGFSLRAHPLQFLRETLNGFNVKTAQQLRDIPLHQAKMAVTVAGIAILRQRPGTAKGMVFLTLEDETGLINLMIRPRVYEQYRNLVISHSVLMARGLLEKVSSVLYIQTTSLDSLDSMVKTTAPNLFPSRSYSY